MSKPKEKGILTITLQFDLARNAESFVVFCRALHDAGFKSEVRQMGRLLQKEAAKRGIKLGTEVAK